MASYRADLTRRAKDRRKDPVAGERWVWQELRGFRKAGLVFRREQPFGQYILDFYCSTFKLAVEIDGWSHIVDGDGDAARDEWLESAGITVLHFPSPKNRKEADGIAISVGRHCEALGWVPKSRAGKR